MDGLEVNAQLPKHVLTSRLQNAGENKNIQLGNKPFEDSVSYKY